MIGIAAGVIVTLDLLTMLARNYAARVLLFPDRAILVFLAGFVATDSMSVAAAAVVLLPGLSTEVVRISR